MSLWIIELLVFFMTPLSPVVEKMGPEPRIRQESCIDCHSDKVENEVRHEALEMGCDICHESTGESHPEDGKKGFKLVERTPELCYYCHEEPAAPPYDHVPVTDGECLSCHEVHGSANQALVKLPDPNLCLSCHPLIQGKLLPHTAIESGGCMICHLPHGAELRAMLTERFPEGEYVLAHTDNFGLCFLCHDTDLMDAEQTEWGTNFRNGKQNLHYLHIQGEKGRSCTLCHNLHVSRQKFLIAESIPFGNWEMQMNFANNEDGGSCLPGCHGKKTYARNGIVSP